MNDTINLHICCGDVYLEGYTNIDIKGRLIQNHQKNPNKTTIDKYYKHPFRKSKPREFLIDKQMNILQRWDYKDNSVDEIVMICAIEHFTRTEAEFIISEIKRILKPGKQLKIDFPDIREDVKRYYKHNPEFLMELIYCNHKDKFSTHNWGYTKTTFRKLLGKGWKEIVWINPVEHDYPMIGAVCIKEDNNEESSYS
jgi:hypothetical protein